MEALAAPGFATVFEAGDEPVRSRLEALKHAVGDTIAPLDVRVSGDAADICDSIRSAEAGAARVLAVRLSPGEALRTPRLIRRSDPDLCKIDVVLDGRVVVEQDGRQAELGPGDVSFVDLSRPCRWTTPVTGRGVAVMFPRALLSLRPDDLARATAVRMPGDEGLTALVSSLARALPAHLGTVPAAPGDWRLVTALLDLLAATLAARVGRAVPQETSQRALLHRVRAFIERELCDPDLSPATIAAAHHISVRTLHKLFRAQETTVAGWIRRRRLELCRRDLLDPSLRHRPVAAIAARHGLTDPAHFTRLFRAAYGVPPARYRAERMQETG